MRSRIPAPLQAAAAVAALLVLPLIGCRAPGGDAGPSADVRLADRLEKLPALPADLASTLDPKTNATKIDAVQPLPGRIGVSQEILISRPAEPDGREVGSVWPLISLERRSRRWREPARGRRK